MFSTPLSDLAQETLPKLSVIVGLAEGVYCIRHNGYSGAHVQGRVLVVDDNVMVRESYTELLRGRGYEVEQAGDGEQALAVMRSKQMDLAIVDVMMPSMGGLELRQRLDESSPKVATILVTGQPARVEELV